MSPTSEFRSFFSPPASNRGRASPLCDAIDGLMHISVSPPWSLSVDTAFGECESSHDDGCTYSSTSTLCAALGLSTSPKSSTPAFKSSSPPDSPRWGRNSTSPRPGNDGSCYEYAETHPTLDSPKPSVEPIQMGNGPTVFIWDLDETLIIFQTLLDGRYVELFDGFKDSQKATCLGRRWERLILEVCDDYFFYYQVEEHNHSNVNSLKEYDDGADLGDFNFGEHLKPPLSADDLRKLSHLHRYASHLYDQGLETLLSLEQAKEWRDLYEATDTFTNGWLSAGRQKLEELQKANEQALQGVKRKQALQFPETSSSDGSDANDGGDGTTPDLSAYNFLVTSGTLIPTLVKCLLFKLNPYFNPSNIFSSREVGKLQCCRWICDRFSHGERFPKWCVIGDGPDEREAARVLGWPFLHISIDPDAADQLPLLSPSTVEEHMQAVYRNPGSSMAPHRMSH